MTKKQMLEILSTLPDDCTINVHVDEFEYIKATHVDLVTEYSSSQTGRVVLLLKLGDEFDIIPYDAVH